MRLRGTRREFLPAGDAGNCTETEKGVPMSKYRITWITENLAVGYAPMSYEDFDAFRGEGIDAIVNLCAEFCDLREIEEKSGFEVFYLPMLDECAPELDELERSLDWLDEALYLGKKVLVHCRFGIGRTGTFVTSYLVRKGLQLKYAEKALKHSCAAPSSHRQWRFLRKYSKKLGLLKRGKKSMDGRHLVDMGEIFRAYEGLVADMDAKIEAAAEQGKVPIACGKDNTACCVHYLELPFLEVVYISDRMKRKLRREQRLGVIQGAAEMAEKIEAMKQSVGSYAGEPEKGRRSFLDQYGRKKLLCPLSQNSRCLLYDYRPVKCRLYGVPEGALDVAKIEKSLLTLSKVAYEAYCESSSKDGCPSFSMADTLSGRYVQTCFHRWAEGSCARRKQG